MATPQDSSVGLAIESTYKTGVTVARWLEFLDESLTFNKNVKQGMGLRVGTRVARSGRRVVPTADAGGDISLEALSKGMGLLWQACFGSGVSTLVSGSTQQQVFTLADIPPSATIQKGLVQAGGTVDPYTFLGGMVESFEISCPNGDIVTLKVTADCGDLTTATAYAAPSYAAGANLYHFAGGAIASGTLTAPTGIALASGTTTIADVRSFSVGVNNKLATDRYNFGGAGRKAKPTVGLREIAGSMGVEYDVSTWRDAVLNETPMMLILTFSAGALSAGNETLQIVLPEIKIDSPLSQANGTDLITTDLSFTVLDNLTAAQPIWLVVRTADAAL
jgi:hypothetical protein